MRRPAAAAPRAALAAAALVLAAGCHASRGGSAVQGDLTVSHAVVPVPASRAEASVFMVIENRSGARVTLVGATSPEAESIRLDRDIGGQMQTVPGIDIPARGRLRLVPGSYHLMLVGVGKSLALGDTVTLHLSFEPHGAITVRAPLLTYTDAISDLPMR
ncbi:MAG: copper chaperone PCu(A)C [Gemmatimonadales bacterium]|jgi:copper(I)-binding protein